MQTGWAAGSGALVLVYTALYAFLPEAIAWRAVFATGLLPAVFVFWIRRHIDEPEILRDTRRDRPAVDVTHLFSAFRGPQLWTTVKVSLMVAGVQGGGYALGIWMPTWLRTVRGLSATDTGNAVARQADQAKIGAAHMPCRRQAALGQHPDARLVEISSLEHRTQMDRFVLQLRGASR